MVWYCACIALAVCLPEINAPTLKTIQKLIRFFRNKHEGPLPLLIIKKSADDPNVKEYTSIEEAIADLETDPNVSPEKIEKLRSSFNMLKNKSSIRIRNGELIK